MSNPRSELRQDRLAPVFDRILLARPLPVEVDWTRWLRAIERKRSVARSAGVGIPASFNRQMTLSSFRLDGIDVTDADLDDAAARRTRARRSFASRQRQRLRNHMAILLSIARRLTRRQPLRVGQVVRWYTSVSAGLSMSSLDLPGMQRIESAVRRINSPQMRLQPAITEIARLHTDLLADPMFPSFNGILARLLLQVHLGHCGLPLVVFDPASDPPRLNDPALLLPRLLELIDTSFDRLTTH
jgi:hypothetical protein